MSGREPERLVDSEAEADALRVDLARARADVVDYDVAAGVAAFEVAIADVPAGSAPDAAATPAAAGAGKVVLIAVAVAAVAGAAAVGLSGGDDPRPAVTDARAVDPGVTANPESSRDPSAESNGERSASPHAAGDAVPSASDGTGREPRLGRTQDEAGAERNADEAAAADVERQGAGAARGETDPVDETAAGAKAVGRSGPNDKPKPATGADAADAARPKPNAKPRPSSPKPATKQPAADRLQAEMRATDRARKALAGDPARALSLAQQADRDFAEGLFAEQRAGVKALALFKLGKDTQARNAANAYLRKYPKGTYADQIRKRLDEKP